MLSVFVPTRLPAQKAVTDAILPHLPEQAVWIDLFNPTGPRTRR